MFCKRLWDGWTTHIQVKFKKELLFTCPRSEHLSCLFFRNHTVWGLAGDWLACVVLENSQKNLRQYHFGVFLSEKSHHTFSKQLSDITSSHHHIIWSLPRNEAFHSGTVGLRTLQRVIYPNITTEVGGLDDNGEDFFHIYSAMKQMRK